jgi:hypothetical protein
VTRYVINFETDPEAMSRGFDQAKTLQPPPGASRPAAFATTEWLKRGPVSASYNSASGAFQTFEPLRFGPDRAKSAETESETESVIAPWTLTLTPRLDK